MSPLSFLIYLKKLHVITIPDMIFRALGTNTVFSVATAANIEYFGTKSKNYYTFYFFECLDIHT